MIDVDVAKGTPGVALHGNPMYGGRALGLFTMCLAAVIVGAAYNALDEYEVADGGADDDDARRSSRASSTPTSSATSARRGRRPPRRRLPFVTARSSTWSCAAARPRRASRSRTGTTCCWAASAAR